MPRRDTITKTEMHAVRIEMVLAHSSGGGIPKSKWLHFIYDLKRQRLAFRVHWMQRGEAERESFSDTLDEAIAAYNEI